MSIKNHRSIFAFNNFRGLDLENKPLKVKPFRAPMAIILSLTVDAKNTTCI